MQLCVLSDGFDEWQYAFCDLFKTLFPLSKKCKRDIDVINIIKKVLNTCSNQFIFHVLMMIYRQEQDDANIKDKNHQLRLGKIIGFKWLAELSLLIATSQTVDNQIEWCLESAVWFAKRGGNTLLNRDANTRLGDYYFAHLWPDNPNNIAIAAMNDCSLLTIMQLYKEAGDHVKLEKATIAYQDNKAKIIFLSFQFMCQ